MKIILVLFTMIFVVNLQSQNYRKIVPFKYQNQWGIVDSLNNEIVKPIYKNVNVFDDFLFAEFDGIELYNLKTGNKQKAIGSYLNTLNLEGEKYYAFNATKNTVLINFESKDTVQLAEKFNRIEIISLYNLEDEKVNELVVAYLDYPNVMLLKNDKNLTPINNKKFKNVEVETIEMDTKIIGFAYKDKGNFIFYDSSFKIIKSIKDVTDRTTYYDLLPNDVIEKLPVIYNVENASSACFTCESVWDNSWDLSTFLGDKPDDSKYYIIRENRNDYLKDSLDPHFKIEVYSDLFDYQNPYEMITIRKSNSSFFCDSRYIKVPHILFPQKYLK